jgi:hypothetical protein
MSILEISVITSIIGAPIHPNLGMPPSGMGNYPNQIHPGMQNMGQPYVGQGQQHMNIQPLRGEQHYAQQPPQFGGAQPQNQVNNDPQKTQSSVNRCLYFFLFQVYQSTTPESFPETTCTTASEYSTATASRSSAEI